MDNRSKTAGYYGIICDIQRLAWKDDDRMDQETLFDLQERIANFALLIAEDENRVDDLVKAFPWVYEVKED